jgi:hypothetical protein
MATNIVSHTGKNRDWICYKNGANRMTLTFTENSVAKDMTAYTFVVNIRKWGSSTNELQLTQAAGITNGGSTGIVTIDLTKTQASTTLPGDSYFYEVVYTYDSKEYALLQKGLQLLAQGNSEDTTTSLSFTVSLAGASEVDVAVTLVGGGVGAQDLYMGAVGMWPRTTSGCAELAKSEIATSLVNIQTLDFDQTAQEFVQFTLALPRNWNNGTVTARFYWTAAAGTAAQTVQWGIKGGAYSNDDPLTTALGTEVTVDDALIATNDLHISDVTAAITLAGSPADADFLAFQISRNPASDTLAADAKLIGVLITITTDAGTAA